ncbi:MAG: AMP-binding protein [Proteobacteria bacterium]|nr:AMP-binding protein [Pseudomonadota bacterium]
MEKYTDLSLLNFSTLGELMRNSVQKYPERPLWGIKKDGVYQWMTYAEFGVIVRKLRTILKKNGIVKGERIAIISNNCMEFAAAVYASYGLGGVIVPMYEVQKVQDWEYIFGDSTPAIAIVGSDAIREKIEGISCESLRKIFVIRAEKPEDCLRAIIDAESEETEIDENIQPDDICDIIYTSGTTGRPRGVVLLHGAVAEDTRVTAGAFLIGKTDRTLAFLPWAHAFGKTVELHVFPSVGAATGLVESTRTIQQNLVEVNPTILVSVPQIFNRIYDKVHSMVEDKQLKKYLFERTEKIARKAMDGNLSFFGKVQHRILDKLVADKVRGAFGNSLRFCISGGASLSKEVATFFEAFGVRIYEGYGMTEHSPVVAVNNPALHRIGSVGRPLQGVKIEILHDNENLDKSDERCGEIVITSPCVMKEYYNAPEATLEMLDDQHRLHTGDMGYLDEDGCLWITGRVKEQYKLENGKYVVPTALEEKINDCSIISLAVVFGAGRPYNVVLIKPDDEYVEKFKANNHLENASAKDIENNEEFRKAFSEALEKACAEFRGYERPRKFAITLDEFSIQNGLLTPALKIRRRIIEKKYSDILNALYQ